MDRFDRLTTGFTSRFFGFASKGQLLNILVPEEKENTMPKAPRILVLRVRLNEAYFSRMLWPMTKDDIRRHVQGAVPALPFKERVKRIALFGSYLHGSARSGSDVDLLVEFAAPVSYFELFEIERHLARSLGCRVDVVTPKALSPFFRGEVLREAESLYES